MIRKITTRLTRSAQLLCSAVSARATRRPMTAYNGAALHREGSSSLNHIWQFELIGFTSIKFPCASSSFVWYGMLGGSWQHRPMVTAQFGQ